MFTCSIPAIQYLYITVGTGAGLAHLTVDHTIVSAMQFLILLTFGVAFLHIVNAAKTLPPELQRCKEDDPTTMECLKGAMQGSIPYLVKGIQSVGVFPIDPLAVTAMAINQAGGSAVNIKLDLTDEVITGFSDMVINSVDGSTKLDNYHLKIKVFIPRFEMNGHYDLDGKVLLLPLVGSGMSNLTLVNMNVGVDIMGKPFEKKGDKYLDVTDFILDIQPERLYMHFDNLLNGAGDGVGDQLNVFLNENWSLIYQELKPSIDETFGAIFKEISGRLYGRVPYKNIVE